MTERIASMAGPESDHEISGTNWLWLRTLQRARQTRRKNRGWTAFFLLTNALMGDPFPAAHSSLEYYFKDANGTVLIKMDTAPKSKPASVYSGSCFHKNLLATTITMPIPKFNPLHQPTQLISSISW
jgi:hypothetical protein